jgi:hypothetical protein
MAAPINNLLWGSGRPAELFDLVMSEYRRFSEEREYPMT